MSAQHLITEHIDLWTSSIKARNTQGRGSSKKRELYGIKKLRELILELAVRGKLVPQESNDEPASVLMARIAAEKAQLVKDKKIKKYKPLPEISEEEKQFELPEGWAYQRFIDVLDFSGGGQPPKSYFSDEPQEGYVQLIQIRDLGPNPQPVYVLREKVSKFCTSNDVMVGRYGASVGKVFWGKNGAYNVALIKIHNDLNSYTQGFIYLLLKSPLGQGLFGGISRSAQAGFSKDDIAPKLIPVLSLPEQKRIVAKVDELMALCDQLEQQTEASLDAHNLLVDTLLSTLTNARDASELSDNWARLADHFDTLITTDYAVEQLKQCILQLAVMGKLVPQDPNDEPASELIKRIVAEKNQLILDKKIKKQKPLPPISEEEAYIELPAGWERVRLGYVTMEQNQGVNTTTEKVKYSEHGIPVVQAGGVAKGYVEIGGAKYIDSETYVRLKETFKPQNGDILYSNIGANFGVAAIVTEAEPFVISWNVLRFKFSATLSLGYMRYWLNNKYVRDFAWSQVSTSTVPFISGGKISAYILPMPPLEEQHRIVVKVDQLMSLCDQLNARLTEAQTTQLHLADTVVGEALN